MEITCYNCSSIITEDDIINSSKYKLKDLDEEFKIKKHNNFIKCFNCEEYIEI